MKPYVTFVGALGAVAKAAKAHVAHTTSTEWEKLPSGQWRLCMYR